MPFEQTSTSNDNQEKRQSYLVNSQEDLDERIERTYFAQEQSTPPHRAAKTQLGLRAISRSILEKSLKDRQEKERLISEEKKQRSRRLIGFVIPRLLIMILIGVGAAWFFMTYQEQLPSLSGETDNPMNIIVITPTNSQEPTASVTPIFQPTTRPQRPRSTLTLTPLIGVTTLPPIDSGATTEPPLTDTIRQGGGNMLLVEEGVYTMGSGETMTFEHPVYLDAFYIDQHEVTNAQWAACIDDEGCAVPAETSTNDDSPYYDDPEFAKYPVNHVSWYLADQYCRWRGARLPTEAEWEKAARWNPKNDTVTSYPWGDRWIDEVLNYSGSDSWTQTAPVGSFREGASAVGVWDMAGNVSEWVADWFDRDYYQVSPEKNPTGPADGVLRSVRGGSWRISDPILLLSTNRARFAPETVSSGIGLRCAISANQVNDE